MAIIFVLSIFGFFSGITMVLFGFGGGFVVVPLIYRVISTTRPADAMHIAVATSMAVMIFNALFSTYRNQRYLVWSTIFPIILYVALGSIVGAALSMSLSDRIIRYLFIIYLLVTILDCLLRKGFLDTTEKVRTLAHGRQVAYGVGIGLIATMLGVGGSVMTVPLMRRLGNNMKSAVAMANPLSVPVAVMGSLLYGLMSSRSNVSAPHGFIGYVDMEASAVLAAAGFAGIALAGRWLPKIPDDIHARVYLVFLTLALIAMI